MVQNKIFTPEAAPAQGAVNSQNKKEKKRQQNSQADEKSSRFFISPTYSKWKSQLMI